MYGLLLSYYFLAEIIGLVVNFGTGHFFADS